MVEMENAAVGSSTRTGWIGRTLGLTTPSGPFAAVQMGWGDVPDSVIGPVPVLAMHDLGDFSIAGVSTSSDRARWSTALSTLHAGAPAPVLAATETTVGALSTVAAITATSYRPANGAVYPSGDLGDTLKDVARIIKSGLGVQAVTLDVGNWDMHAGLGPTGNPRAGWMWNQLVELGSALAAFAKDMGTGMNSTTVVTLSEFGRRAYENDSNGVDHGWGNATFVLGGGVNGGHVYGTWPGLGVDDMVDGDLAVTTDYRTVLADILRNRVGATIEQLGTVAWSHSIAVENLPGPHAQEAATWRSCVPGSSEPRVTDRAAAPSVATGTPPAYTTYPVTVTPPPTDSVHVSVGCAVPVTLTTGADGSTPRSTVTGSPQPQPWAFTGTTRTWWGP